MSASVKTKENKMVRGKVAAGVTQDVKDKADALLKKYNGREVPDSEVHAIAEKAGIPPHDLESYIYSLASEHVLEKKMAQRVAIRYIQAQEEAEEEPSSMELLQDLLSYLRFVYFMHWTAHWQVQGPTQYEDHLLFQRFYEAMPEEIDGLAEKIVAKYGAEAVALPEQLERMSAEMDFLVEHGEEISLLRKALMIEETLQEDIQNVLDVLEARMDMTPGMNDFLSALANDHETNIYLLQQRTGTSPTEG